MAQQVTARCALGKRLLLAYASIMGEKVLSRRNLLAIGGVTVVAIVILLIMNRPLICTCGTVELWGEVGPKQSQMLADWYSFSHIIHGFLFYAMFRLILGDWSFNARLTVAMLVESFWEILENSPMIIDRYREATIALGYTGDSILNSVSDILMMAIGFLAARKLPVWASIAIVIVLELIPLYVIRDNLTLNIWMLIAPSDAIRVWQAGV